MNGPVDIARDAWGDDLPDWVLALAQACALTSQNRVAEDLGRSASLVSTVLRKKYPGNMEAIEERVRGVSSHARFSAICRRMSARCGDNEPLACKPTTHTGCGCFALADSVPATSE